MVTVSIGFQAACQLVHEITRSLVFEDVPSNLWCIPQAHTLMHACTCTVCWLLHVHVHVHVHVDYWISILIQASELAVLVSELSMLLYVAWATHSVLIKGGVLIYEVILMLLDLRSSARPYYNIASWLEEVFSFIGLLLLWNLMLSNRWSKCLPKVLDVE